MESCSWKAEEAQGFGKQKIIRCKRRSRGVKKKQVERRKIGKVKKKIRNDHGRQWRP